MCIRDRHGLTIDAVSAEQLHLAFVQQLGNGVRHTVVLPIVKAAAAGRQGQHRHTGAAIHLELHLLSLIHISVLSSATICVRPAASSKAAVLNKMPFFAPMPLPTMMATGVARPRAQGQLLSLIHI